MFKNILLSNIQIDESNKNYRKLFMSNLVYLLSMSVFIIFSIVNIWIREDIVTGILEFIFFIFTFAGFIYLRKSKNINKSAKYVNNLLFITILSILFVFKFSNGVEYWVLLFPFITMSLSSNIKEGIKYVIAFNIISYFGAYYYWSQSSAIPTIEFVRFVNVSVIISFLVYFYEKTIMGFINKQTKLNDSLILRAKEARELAITDSLTDLYNKRHFDYVINNEFNRSKRSEEPFILAIIDVDNFKLYNDTYGHGLGNSALENIGNILKQQTSRSGDYAFRVGGEEFAVILQSSTMGNVFDYFDELRKKIEHEQIEHVNNKPYGILTISIGVVCIVDYEDINTFITYKKADLNLYAVKNSGRNAVKLTKVVSPVSTMVDTGL